MVTIKDIAKELGISASTVSQALSDSTLVNERTKREVLQVAERLGYERNELARDLPLEIRSSVRASTYILIPR